MWNWDYIIHNVLAARIHWCLSALLQLQCALWSQRYVKATVFRSVWSLPIFPASPLSLSPLLATLQPHWLHSFLQNPKLLSCSGSLLPMFDIVYLDSCLSPLSPPSSVTHTHTPVCAWLLPTHLGLTLIVTLCLSPQHRLDLGLLVKSFSNIILLLITIMINYLGRWWLMSGFLSG